MTTIPTRLTTLEVKVGDLLIGNQHPVRVQTMTTTDTMDTMATVEQSIRCIEAGAELIRITAPSKREAENLLAIRQTLHSRGYHTPLVADIHFTPNAAEIAARIVEKVRVNPGNYVDKKKFEFIEYTEQAYQEEIARIRERFTPLVKICKEYGTAMRIGTNHGSLSDRIMSRYGDTPMGMVESAMEFLRISRDENYHNIVLSMKSSNPLVMVHAYRLLVETMQQEFGVVYPLHLGVTEAGDGEDGRIKSAVGIGTLMEEGLGDTIRVSLTEDPEFEIPVCLDLVKRYAHRPYTPQNPHLPPYSRVAYRRRPTVTAANIGGGQVPVVVADFADAGELQAADLASVGYRYDATTDKWNISDGAADYIFTGDGLPGFALPGTLGVICDYRTWAASGRKNDQVLEADDLLDHSLKESSPKEHFQKGHSPGDHSLEATSREEYAPDRSSKNIYPLLDAAEFIAGANTEEAGLCFVKADCYTGEADDLLEAIAGKENIVLCLSSTAPAPMPSVRDYIARMMQAQLSNPVILMVESRGGSIDEQLIHFSAEAGAPLLDGMGDGLWLKNDPSRVVDQRISGRTYLEMKNNRQFLNNTCFSILQATRTRISKTEYISCPSCGRTLFDLQETTAKIRAVTNHLKGVKIAIMGCIVNGPGEMADADFGYVGSGPGKITLYRGKEVVKRAVSSEVAVEELIGLLKDSGVWIDPS